jgi:hypothetical protein
MHHTHHNRERIVLYKKSTKDFSYYFEINKIKGIEDKPVLLQPRTASTAVAHAILKFSESRQIVL